MAVVRRFEDLVAWQEARSLAKQIYQFTERSEVRRDFGFTDQIRRAALSIMNNIVEGFDSGSRLEFIKFLSYARRSASEVQSCLYVALDRGHLGNEEFVALLKKADYARNLVAAFIRYLREKGRRDSGKPVAFKIRHNRGLAQSS